MKAAPGIATYPSGDRNAESDQHENLARHPRGAGRDGWRAHLPAAILQQQQKDAEERKAEDEAFRRRVGADKMKHNSAAANEGKTWKKYIP
jgi:hypothetical protein